MSQYESFVRVTLVRLERSLVLAQTLAIQSQFKSLLKIVKYLECLAKVETFSILSPTMLYVCTLCLRKTRKL